MSSFAKLVAVFAAALLTAGALAGKPANEKPKPGTNDAGQKKAGKEKPAAAPDAPKAIDVPVLKGHDAKGLKIPYFDGDGKLQMTFDIGVASRLDENHIQMADLRIETFDAAGQPEMSIDLPASVLDLTTSVISTEKTVKIKRSDFELTGQTMQFNTKTRQGGLGGKVRMLIYNLEVETSDAAKTPDPKAK
jgi:hypothetical protein